VNHDSSFKRSGVSLSVRAVVKSYQLLGQHIQVLRGVNLEVPCRTRLAIVGSSGSGKSTLLHILGTLDRPDEGDILYNGVSILNRSPHALAQLRNQQVGFVFQFHHLLPEFSSLENVMMPCLIARESVAISQEKAKTRLQEVGLTHRLHHKPSELSGGEQQRVALARALVMNPDILFADEVTGNLDKDTALGIHDLLCQINEERHISLVVVTHNEELARKIGQVVRLSQGQLQNL